MFTLTKHTSTLNMAGWTSSGRPAVDAELGAILNASILFSLAVARGEHKVNFAGNFAQFLFNFVLFPEVPTCLGVCEVLSRLCGTRYDAICVNC